MNQHDECRIESCPDAPDGKFFVDRCNTKNCTNAPVRISVSPVCSCVVLVYFGDFPIIILISLMRQIFVVASLNVPRESACAIKKKGDRKIERFYLALGLAQHS